MKIITHTSGDANEPLHPNTANWFREMGEDFGARLVGVDTPIPRNDDEWGDEVQLWFSKDLDRVTSGEGSKSYNEALTLLRDAAKAAFAARKR